MTATVPETDRTVIGHLDFDIPCDGEECDAPARWEIATHMRCCESTELYLFCDVHKTQYLRWFTTPFPIPVATCRACGLHLHAHMPADAIILDRVAPIHRKDLS